MSAVYPLSQAGFSDFVANLQQRQRAGRKGPGRRARNVPNEDALPAQLTELDPMPASVVDRNVNEKALPPQYQPLANQPEVLFTASDNEKAAATDAAPVQGGKKRGHGHGPRARRQAQDLGGEGPRGRRMRMALFDEGSFPSEEEVNAMAEVHRLRRMRRQADATATPGDQELAAMADVRRLRRARRQANGLASPNGNGNGNGNGNSNGQGPRARRMQKRLEKEAIAAERGNNVDAENQPKRGMGPRGLRRRNNAEASGPRQMALRSGKVIEASSDEEKTLVEPRGLGHRARGGLKLTRQPDEMPRGGPAKFAPALNQDAIPSNDEANGRRFYRCGDQHAQNIHHMQNLNIEENNEFHGRRGMNRGGLGQGRRQHRFNRSHIVPGPEMHQSGMAPALRKRQARKLNQTEVTEDEPKGNKSGKPANGRKNAFKPRPDIFDTPGSYILHLPAPGATQKDIGIMWDAEKNVLRIAGMIQRPAAEQIAEGATLVRALRPIGPFRRAIRLGKKNDKVRIYENGITAKLEDGILKVEVPKYDGDDMTSDGEFVEVKQAY